jgi:2,3-bisphosphoglycerate-dependent phosphoglycerate mutase
MEIVLVRHGEPEWVVDGLNVDYPPLTELGHRQAALMAGSLADENFDEILASPLIRARQTAAPLFELHGREERIDEWLSEIRGPVWQGTPRSVAEESYAAERRKVSHERWHGLADDGGESNRDFIDRIRLGCQRFLADRGVTQIESSLPLWRVENPGRRIALVAHAGTNAAIISYLLGLQPLPWEWDRFVLGHTSISRVQAIELGDGFTFTLRQMGAVEHLDKSDRTM